MLTWVVFFFFFFQAEDGIRDFHVTGVQTCALPIFKKHGGIDAEALRKAALEVDLPEGGTMLGFGVKFAGDGSPMAGQNERAFPIIIQYVDDKPYVVWPKSLQQREPVLPLPGSSVYSAS